MVLGREFSHELLVEAAHLVTGILPPSDGETRRVSNKSRTVDAYPRVHQFVMQRVLLSGQCSTWDESRTWKLIEYVVSTIGDDAPTGLVVVKYLVGSPSEDYSDELRIPRTSKTIGEARAVENKPYRSAPYLQDPILRRRVAAYFLGLDSEQSFAVSGRPGLRVRTAAADLLTHLCDCIDAGEIGQISYLRDENANKIEPGSLSYGTLERLDYPPRHYPQTEAMRPSELGCLLTLSPVAEREMTSQRASDDLLYGTPVRFGGEAVSEAIKGHKRVAILGDPGSGKSTIGLHYALEKSRAGVPVVFAAVSRLPETRCVTIQDGAATLVQVMDEMTGAPSEESLLGSLLNDEDSVIVLDGIDEAHTSELKNSVSRILRTLDGFKGQVVLTSRFMGYRRPHPGRWDEFVVDRLDSDARSAFIDSWYGTGAASDGMRRCQELLAEAQRSDLMDIPVLLGIVAYVASNGEVPRNRASLYERYIALYLQGVWRPDEDHEDSPMRLAEIYELLIDTAWSMATLDGRPAAGSWRDRATPSDLIKMAPTSQIYDDGQTLNRISGVLCPDGHSLEVMHRPLRWLHRTMHEHLCAVYLVRLESRDPEKFFEVMEFCAQNSTTWIEPLKELAAELPVERLSNAVRRLSGLVEAGDPGGEISFTLSVLARHGSIEAGLSDQLWDNLVKQELFALAYAWDSGRTLALILELASTSDQDWHFWHGQLAADDMSSRVLAEVLEACLDIHAPNASNAYWAVGVMFSGDKQAAFDKTMAYIRDTGCIGVITAIDTGDLDGLTVDVETLRAIFSACPGHRSRLRLARRLLALGLDISILKESGGVSTSVLELLNDLRDDDYSRWSGDCEYRAMQESKIIARLGCGVPLDVHQLSSPFGHEIVDVIGFLVSPYHVDLTSAGLDYESAAWIRAFEIDCADTEGWQSEMRILVDHSPSSSQELWGNDTDWGNAVKRWAHDVRSFVDMCRAVARVLLGDVEIECANLVNAASLILERDRTNELHGEVDIELDTTFMVSHIQLLAERFSSDELYEAILVSDLTLWNSGKSFSPLSLLPDGDNVQPEKLVPLIRRGYEQDSPLVEAIFEPQKADLLVNMLLKDEFIRSRITASELDHIASKWLERRGLLPEWRAELLTLQREANRSEIRATTGEAAQ